MSRGLRPSLAKWSRTLRISLASRPMPMVLLISSSSSSVASLRTTSKTAGSFWTRTLRFVRALMVSGLLLHGDAGVVDDGVHEQALAHLVDLLAGLVGGGGVDVDAEGVDGLHFADALEAQQL